MKRLFASGGDAEFVLLSALWGASFLFMHIAAASFGPVPTAGLRVAIAALAMAPVLGSPAIRAALTRHWPKALVTGLLNAGLPFVFYTYAVLHLPTGITAILNATTPLFGALVARLWLGERSTGWRLAGLAIGFAGVAWLTVGGGGGSHGAGAGHAGTTLPLLPVLACLGATLSYGIAASFVRRHMAGVPPAAITGGSMAGAALALAVPTVLSWPAAGSGAHPGAPAWLSVIAVGVLCTALAYFLYYRIIEAAGPARALAVTFLSPVFAVGYGVALLGETLTPAIVGAGAVTLLGTLLASGMVRPRAGT